MKLLLENMVHHRVCIRSIVKFIFYEYFLNIEFGLIK